ncbi:hypothetical protein MY4824_003050 [Beauveria thailandica]
MDSLSTGRVAQVLEKLHREADLADGPMYQNEPADDVEGHWVTRIIESEMRDLKGTYRGLAGNFLSVSPTFGRHLYMAARACKAKCIVEFGTSMGVSAIYMAAALRDNGGGRLITTEFEPGKAESAKAHIMAAGLEDLVEVRVGDARQTLASGIGNKIDMLLIDGALSLYLPVLKMMEPHLESGALIFADNATDNATDNAGGYIKYVRDPANGYISIPLSSGEHEGNEFTIKTR